MQNKKLSQVFLRDFRAVSDVFGNLDLKGKTVLEIGAGEGAITKVLARKAKRVIALEVDESLIPKLFSKLKKFKNVEIVHADALQANLDYENIVGFLPYHISAPLIFRILDSKFSEALLCVQKEVALRMVAQPNSSEYSRLSVMVQGKSDVDFISVVPKEAFSPVPKVDSALVYLRKANNAKLNDKIISTLFQHRNQSVSKSLFNSRSSLFPEKNKNEARKAIDSAIPSNLAERRVRTLSLSEFEEISGAFGS